MTNTDMQANAQAAPASESQGPKVVSTETEIETIKKAMRAYKYFAGVEEMIAALNKASAETSDFLGLPVFPQGIEQDDSGNYVLSDPDKYADSIPVLGYVGGQQKDANGKNQSVIKAVVAFGIPTVEKAFESAPDLVSKVLGKEFRHVYFRNFRDATSLEQMQAGFATAPVNIEDFAASHARGAAEELDTDTFDAIWPSFRKALVSQYPAYAKALPAKGEVIKGIRSKSYAEGVHGDLESRNVFLTIAAAMVKTAEDQDTPLDASAIKEWAQNRDTTHIAFRSVTDDELDALGTFSASDAAEALGLS